MKFLYLIGYYYCWIINNFPVLGKANNNQESYFKQVEYWLISKKTY